MATKCLAGRAHRLRFLVGCAASILVALHTLASGAGPTATDAGNLATTGGAASPALEKDGRVNVKTYGAVGDGATNDTPAFNAALKSLANTGSGVCLVPKGTYLISASGITSRVKSGIHLVGEGRGVSILKVVAMPTAALVWGDGDNWSVENLTFDMGDYTPTPVGFPAVACKGNNWRVSNCAVVKSGRWGIAAFGGSNWSIEGNSIHRTVPGAMPPTGAILVTAQKGVWSSHGRVADNVCEGAGISFSGTDGIVAHNRVNGSGSGSGIFVQGSPSTRSPTIIGNICTGGSSGYDGALGGKWASVTGFEIWAPDAVVCDNTAHDNDAGGIAIGGQNSIVIANTAYNNGRAHAGFGGFAARVNPNRGASASHSIFIGNSSHDQDYGYLEQAAGLTDIKHFGNDYNHNRVGPIKSRAPRGSAVAAQVSPDMKSKLNALAKDTDLSDNARRALRAYLAR
jgi:parallel beta-helix repeat protein